MCIILTVEAYRWMIADIGDMAASIRSGRVCRGGGECIDEAEYTGPA